jgi:hypothetical protein
MTTDAITIEEAFQRLLPQNGPHAACERLNAAIRSGSVRLWADDSEVAPGFFATHLYLMAKAAAGRYSAEITMTRATTMPQKWTLSAADVEALRKGPLARRRPGPVTTHEWHAIDGEIARRCIDPKTGRLKVPKNESKLARDVADWCQNQYGQEPADSALREAVRQVCAALRRAAP